jgi:hypothetical protein
MNFFKFLNLERILKKPGGFTQPAPPGFGKTDRFTAGFYRFCKPWSEVRAPCFHAAHDDLRRTCMRMGFSADEGKLRLVSVSKPQVRTLDPADALNPWKGPLPKQSKSPVVTLGHVMASARMVASSRICSPALRKEYIHIDLFSQGNSNSNSDTLSLERMHQVPLFSPVDSAGLAEHACNCFMTRPISSAGLSLGLTKQSGGGVLVGPFYYVGYSTGQVCDLLAATSRSWANRYPGLHLLWQRVASSSKPKCFVHSPSSRQPPVQPPVPLCRTYAEVLKSVVLSGEMAKEGAEVDGWRVMDRRRQ